jgi:hypothetical protein
LKFIDQLSKHGVNLAEALRKMFGAFARGAQRAETEKVAAAAVAFDHAVSCGSCRGGIDAEDTQELAFRSGRDLHGNEFTAAGC